MPRPSRRRSRSRARSSARAPQDGSYKHLFSHPEMVEGLLRDFVQEDWLALIDFSTLEKRGGSYVTDDLRDREDDIIWRVRVAGDWLYVYLLIEFQRRPVSRPSWCGWKCWRPTAPRRCGRSCSG
jgi:hypothetical protein